MQIRRRFADECFFGSSARGFTVAQIQVGIVLGKDGGGPAELPGTVLGGVLGGVLGLIPGNLAGVKQRTSRRERGVIWAAPPGA